MNSTPASALRSKTLDALSKPPSVEPTDYRGEKTKGYKLKFKRTRATYSREIANPFGHSKYRELATRPTADSPKHLYRWFHGAHREAKTALRQRSSPT